MTHTFLHGAPPPASGDLSLVWRWMRNFWDAFYITRQGKLDCVHENFTLTANAATSTLSNWTDIGTTTANATGLYSFEDTNAPAFQQRFYRAREE